jgi:Acyl-CoA dehydrogenase, N-terminal domain/AMP-binding enzyme C-terminal domain
MQRVHYDADHRAFADLAGDFAAKEVAPHINGWDDDGIIPRELFVKAGAVGLLGFAADEQFGGVGAADFRYNQILIEAFMDADCGAVGLSFAVHNDICLPYLAELATPEQQKRWLPGFVSGELIARRPAVQEVAVFGIPHPRWVEAVVAAVVVRDGAHASHDDLIIHSRTHLAGYKAPKQIYFVDSLPKNPSGKLLKRELRAQFNAGQNAFH